jgi:dipeptidyl aminopeptidase/acylaminoacyl peptidase
VKPTDIAYLVTLGVPSVSPDGASAVVASTRPDLDRNEYLSSLWIVDTRGETPPRRLTHGDHDTAPRYSPDGRWIAFLRAEAEGKPQLHLLPTAGGDAQRLTDLPGGAGAPVWSPDSSTIAFAARVPDAGRYGQDDKVPAGKEPPRRVTGLKYRLDDVGFVIDQRSHVFVIDIGDGDGDEREPRQITNGDVEDTHPVWNPNGTHIAFLSARHEGREQDRMTDVFLVERDGSALRRLTDSTLWLSAAAFTADGETILAIGREPGVACNDGLWAVGVATPGRPRRLTDTESTHIEGERIVVDGGDALVPVGNRGATDVMAIPVDGSAPRVVAAGPRRVDALDRSAGVTVVSYADPTTAGDLARVGDDGGFDPLTAFAADLQATGRTVAITELTTSAPDGYPVHGFLALPPGDGPHPVLLMIHGGPFAQYEWALFDEAQVYAGAGYAVVYGNPRGSSAYGQAHGQWIVGDVGERSAVDLLALLDAALERPDLDPERVGVLGGSHGGFMTTWLVGRTDRFRAAVSERAVNAIDSFVGASDIGWDFADHLYGTDPEQRRRQSPLTYADRIDTPLLIIHSEHDWRCPVEQAQRLYVALRCRNAVVEMLLFPGEGHEMSRAGVPSHRVARFDAILQWFERHLVAMPTE